MILAAAILMILPWSVFGASADISCLDSRDKSKVEEACAKAGEEAGKEAKEKNADKCATQANNSTNSVCGKRPTCPAGQEFSRPPTCNKKGEFGNFKIKTKVTKPSKACTDGLKKLKAAENALATAEKAVEKAEADLDKFLKDAVDKDSRVRNARRAADKAVRDLEGAQRKLDQAKADAVKTGAIGALEKVVSASSKAYSNEKGGPVKDKKYEAYTAAYQAWNAAKAAAIAKSAKVGAAQKGVNAAEDKVRGAEINVSAAEFDAQSRAFNSQRGRTLQNNLKTAQERRNKAQQNLDELKDGLEGESGGSCTATVSGGRCIITGEWLYNCVPKPGAPAKELEGGILRQPELPVAQVLRVELEGPGSSIATVVLSQGLIAEVPSGATGEFVIYDNDIEVARGFSLKIAEFVNPLTTTVIPRPVEPSISPIPTEIIPLQLQSVKPTSVKPLLQIGGGILR